jgi:hypothetical protein
MGRKNRNAGARHTKPRPHAERGRLFAFPREDGGLEVREVGFLSDPLSQKPFDGLRSLLEGGSK